MVYAYSSLIAVDKKVGMKIAFDLIYLCIFFECFICIVDKPCFLIKAFNLVLLILYTNR